MNELKCVIIDDEISGRIVLKELISQFSENVKIVGEACNIEEGFTIINTTQPDFIFLDIQMPGGTGFDLLRMFEVINFDVVFVTSFDKYAISAIKFSAIDYLLKPIDINELTECLKKIKVKHDKVNQTSELINNLLSNIDNEFEDKKIAIHVLDKVKFIPLVEIIYIEADINYSNIWTKDGHKYVTTKNLKYLEEMLNESPLFLRVNKSTIINSSCVKDYSKGKDCIITMNNGRQFEISRRKKGELNDKLEKFFI